MNISKSLLDAHVTVLS